MLIKLKLCCLPSLIEREGKKNINRSDMQNIILNKFDKRRFGQLYQALLEKQKSLL